MLRFLSRPLLLDAFGATLAVYLLIGLFSLVTFNLGFMDPVHSALHHVEEEFDKHVHASLSAPDTPFSPPICLVDIGPANRNQIGRMLTQIAQQQPRVVGVDIVFDKVGQPISDTLRQALDQLNRQHRLVMASWLEIQGKEHEEPTTVRRSDPAYRIGPEGYINFVSHAEEDVIRHTLPFYLTTARQEPLRSFAVQVIAKAAPTTYAQLRHLADSETPMRIMYQRDSLRFMRLTEADFQPGNPRLNFLRNSIVLVGSRAGLHDRYFAEDVYQVPIGDGARMAGLDIHANIMAMLLQNEQMYHLSAGWLWWLSVPLCYVLMLFFIYQFQHNHAFFHLFFKTVQFLTAALLVGLSLVLFRYGHVELNVLPLLVPVALSVDVLYFYEPFARKLQLWVSGHQKLAKHLAYETYFQSHTHDHDHKPA